MTKIQITNENDIKKRLDCFLADLLKDDFNRTKIATIIDETDVFLINQKKQKPSYKLKKDDVIEFDDETLKKYLIKDETLEKYDYKLDILFEDDDLLVINKPKDMLTHPTKFERTKTLVNALLSHCGDNLSNLDPERRGIVHRLDKNTAGLMLVAKTDFAHENLMQQIKEKRAKRKYLAIALGEFENKKGTINKALVHYLKDNVKMTIAENNLGLEAITDYNVVKQFKGAALVELELKTGRTHQIRAHLASINHPVFGDELYGAKSFMRNEFYNLKTNQQLLQSYYIGFFHPRSNEFTEFQLEEKDFSKDFIKVLNFLRRENEY